MRTWRYHAPPRAHKAGHVVHWCAICKMDTTLNHEHDGLSPVMLECLDKMIAVDGNIQRSLGGYWTVHGSHRGEWFATAATLKALATRGLVEECDWQYSDLGDKFCSRYRVTGPGFTEFHRLIPAKK